jgi:hypothetical protein
MNRPDSLRVFIDARGVDVKPGATAIEAVEAYDRLLALAVRQGEKILTDSRGLPVDNHATLESGAIFRLVSRRDRSAASNPE